jgi:putative addiction module killer protein
MDSPPRPVVVYQDARGREPFSAWLERQGKALRSAVLRRLGRVADGLLGDSKPLRGGVWELRFTMGGGCRVYFGQDDATVVILCAGSKDTQRRDIERARSCWRDYQEAKP